MYGRGAQSSRVNAARASRVIVESRQPLIYRLRELEVSVPATTTGAPIVYQWRQALRLTGLFLMPSIWTVADWAGLKVQVSDGGEQAIITDGQIPQTASGFELAGTARRWFPLGIDVRAGDRWAWTFRNDTAGALTPIVLVRFEAK